MENATVGQRMRAVRLESGLNQTEFANELLLSKNAVSVMETGLRNPSKRTIKSISERFGVSLEWLVTGKGEMHVDPDKHAKQQLADVCRRHNITGKRMEFLIRYLSMSPQAQDAILAYAEVLQSVSSRPNDDPAPSPTDEQ